MQNTPFDVGIGVSVEVSNFYACVGTSSPCSNDSKCQDGMVLFLSLKTSPKLFNSSFFFLRSGKVTDIDYCCIGKLRFDKR
jgi:hypothetical protein